MNILAIDTSMQACSAAVLAERSTGGLPRVFGVYEEIERGHAERLMAMIDEALARAGLSIKQIDRLAVCPGPGTFTGVRIGVATVRGLALALDLPVVSENALRLIAAKAFDSWPPLPDRLVAVAIDARREQIYLQLFDARGPVDGHGPRIAHFDQIEDLLPADRQLFVVGSGRQILSDVVSENTRQNIFLSDFGNGAPQPDAAILAKLAPTSPILHSSPSPLYLRPPDAKIQAGYAIKRQ